MATSSTSNNYVPPISIPGIGTNIDVNTLVTKLIQAESKGMTLRQTQQKAFQAQLSAVGSLKSALSTVQTAMAALNNPDTFTGNKASGHDTSILTASLSNTAPAGSYQINVTQLAQAQVVSAAGQASSKTPIGGGTPTTLTFSFGNVSGGS